MKHLFAYIVLGVFMCIPYILTAQVSDRFALSQDEILFQRNTDFDELITSEYSFTEEVGNPRLPVHIESFVVPFEATVSDLQVTSVSKQKIDGNFYIYPAQPPIILDGSESPAFVQPNTSVYNSSSPYPGKVAEIISDSYTHGYHIVTVKLYPFEYIPQTREIYLQDISFNINYSISNRTNSIIKPEKQSYRRALLSRQFIEGYVKNVSDIENFKDKEVKVINESNCLNIGERIGEEMMRPRSTSAIDELIPDYIIITNETLKPTFQTLANWKTKKGVPAIIKTIEEIEPNYQGSDLQEKIRNYLKEAYARWGADLFVLLGGDTNIIPARMVKGDKNLFRPTDLYYTTVGGTWNANNNNIFKESGDGTDYGRDFYLGRASVENVQEASIFVNKIINYEKASNISNTSYFNNVLVADAFISKSSDGTLSDIAKKRLKNDCTNYMPANINTWFMFDNSDCSPGPYNYSGQEEPCAEGDIEFNRNNFLSALNNGGSFGLGNFHIVYHMDHSSEKGMGTSSKDKNQSIISNDFDNLTNGNYQQILMTGGCKPATFSVNCIGEHFINNANGGGVAFIGNSDVGYSSEWDQFERFVKFIYEAEGVTNVGRFDIGCAFQSAIGPENSINWRLTLLGDPEMQIWTNRPQNLSVSVTPTTVVSGESTISVTINNLPSGKLATICLQKGTEGYATRIVNSNGTYNFTFTPHTSGQINVTVTAHNFKPYESTIPVSTNQNQNIYIYSLTFDDDKVGNSNGNNDQKIDAGETIELSVRLKNNGATAATGVSATLSCSSPYVSISTDNANYGTINSGGTKLSTTKYVFSIDENAPEILENDLNPVKFTLHITDGANNTYTDVFNINVFSPEIEQANKSIVTTTDGDNIIEPNETVTINIDLFNIGKAQATGITGILSGISPDITRCSAVPRNYPTIDKYGTGTNNSTFKFTVSSSYVVGNPLYFTLQVENEFGKNWSFNFNLLDKPTPVSASTIDFTADRTTIRLFWTPHTPSNIKGYNVYRCDADADGNEVGNYTKLNTFVFPAAFYDDSGLDELTKYYYKISAVSLTGNESELSDAFLAWTSYPFCDGFPIVYPNSIGTSIESSVNVADIDNDNYQEIFTTIKQQENESYIIGLHHDGTEIYDIDGNVTSYSGFAKIDGNIEGILALGDLNNDMEFQVISATRDESDSPANYFYSHSVKDSDHDNKPDMLWRHNSPNRAYRGAVISNIDNSSDGTNEVVFFSEWGGIRIFNRVGELIQSISVGGSYGAPAVADIDNDGDKEIIVGNSNGIYIWHHNGTQYGLSQPFYTLPGYKLCSSIVVCDIDNDGDKEILTSALKTGGHEGRIVALHHNGSIVNGWNGSQTIAFPNDWHTQDISVGDLNNDGDLEVVALGKNVVKVWDKSGVIILSIACNLDPGKFTPLLADIDSDTDLEIIFGSGNENKIYALNMDGTKVVGFPLQLDEGLIGSPCVADVDNDDNNELIAASGNKVYMWKTYGSSDLIEWGRERHDSHNTGEYYKICQPTIITSNTTWNTNKDICGDIIVNSGTLTITSSCIVTMSANTRILIKSGGELKVDGGKIMNANIKALNGGSIVMINNGIINICQHGEFCIAPGATYENQYGVIE